MNTRHCLTLGVGLFLLKLTFAQLLGRQALFCTHCHNAHSWDDCYEEQCRDRDQDCYIHVTEDSHGKRINARCVDRHDHQCRKVYEAKGPGQHGGSLIGKRATTLCETCCDANNCNVEHCKHIQFEQHSNHAGVDRCRKCHLVGIRWVCDHTETCSKGQVCYLQELDAPAFSRHTFYHGGCTDESRCNIVNVEDFERDGWLAEVKHGACCYEPECNKATLLHPNTHTTHPPHTEKATTTTQQPTTTIGTTLPQQIVNYCMACKLNNTDWDCSHQDSCGLGEVCFVQELQLNFLDHKTYYHGGCIKQTECTKAAQTSMVDEHGLADVVHGECCNTDDCNRQILQNYKAVTTPKPTTTTTEATTTTQQPTTTIGTTLPQQIVNHCMACKLNNTDWDCSRQDSCGLGEVCFVQELQLNFLDHKTYYHGGCIKQTECTKAAQTSMVDEHGLADVVHGECCNTDDCNRQILQNYKAVTTPKPTTTTTEAPTTTPKPTTAMTTKETTIPPKPVDHCMECVNEGLSWICNHTATCRTDEVCFIQDLKLTVDIPSLPTTYFHGGCINKAECSKVAHTSVVEEHGLADVVQGECCYTNDCNSQILQKYQGVNSHKTVPPTTQPPQPVSTHTAKPPTTQPPPPQKCEVCKGGVCGLIANNDPVVQCTDAAPFCMNTVENDEHGAQTITKSCASGTECNSKWWHESAKKSACVSYNHLLRYEFPFTCDFCCIGDRCNKEIRPDQTQLFIGTD